MYVKYYEMIVCRGMVYLMISPISPYGHTESQFIPIMKDCTIQNTVNIKNVKKDIQVVWSGYVKVFSTVCIYASTNEMPFLNVILTTLSICITIVYLEISKLNSYKLKKKTFTYYEILRLV